jgi:hypothetical protein
MNIVFAAFFRAGFDQNVGANFLTGNAHARSSEGGTHSDILKRAMDDFGVGAPSIAESLKRELSCHVIKVGGQEHGRGCLVMSSQYLIKPCCQDGHGNVSWRPRDLSLAKPTAGSSRLQE